MRQGARFSKPCCTRTGSARQHRSVWTFKSVNAEKAAQSFVTDAVDMHFAGIETLVYGPGSWHFAPDESISIDEMSKAATVYLATAHRLMRAS